jgi:hypothetical protein
MQKALNVLVIIGFLVADWFMFHDIFKAGEQYTAVEYLVGTLSILVIINSGWSLFKND